MHFGHNAILCEKFSQFLSLFRENTEDIYAGIEYLHGTPELEKLKKFLIEEMGVNKIRFPDTVSLGIKPVSVEGTERLVRAALEFAIDNKKPSVTLVHKGNIMKFTEGKFKEWGYQLAKKEFGAKDLDGGPWQVIDNNGKELIIKDVIADGFQTREAVCADIEDLCTENGI